MATIDEFLVSIGYSVSESDATAWAGALVKFEVLVAKLGEALGRFERGAKDLFVTATADLENLHFVAQRTGASVDGLRATTYALRQVGLDGNRTGAVVESFAARLRQFPSMTGLLHGVGVRTLVNGAVRDQADVFRDTVRALSKMDSYPLAAAYGEALGIPEEALNVLRANVDRFEQLEQESREIFARYGINGDAAGDSSALLRIGWRQALTTLDALFVKIAMSIGPGITPMIAQLKGWLDKHQSRIAAGCLALVSVLGALVAGLHRLVEALFGTGQSFLDFLEWATAGNGLVRAIEVLTGGVFLGFATGLLGPTGVVLTAILGLVAILSPGKDKASTIEGGAPASGGAAASQGGGGFFSRAWGAIMGRRGASGGRASGSWGHAGATGSWDGKDGETFPPSTGAESVQSLAEERQRFADELADPAVAMRLAAYTRAEVGGQGPEAEQAFMETIMNRAASRGQTLRQTLDGSYFPNITHQRAAQYSGDPRTLERYRGTIEAVLGGSNISGFATGNASGTVGFAGGPQTFSSGGERFGIEGPDIGWARRARARAARPSSPFADPPTQPMQIDPIDIEEMLRAPPMGSFSDGSMVHASQETEIVVHGDPDPTQTTTEVGAAQARVNKGLVDDVQKAAP